jgi:hypothetical protein
MAVIDLELSSIKRVLNGRLLRSSLQNDPIKVLAPVWPNESGMATT